MCLKTPKLLTYLGLGLIGTISIATVMALLSNNIIDYITTMISTVMSGLCACVLLGRLWERFNWQGALASLLSGSITSIFVLLNDEWVNFWGNPIIPSLSCALLAGIGISLSTHASTLSREEALEQLRKERQRMDVT